MASRCCSMTSNARGSQAYLKLASEVIQREKRSARGVRASGPSQAESQEEPRRWRRNSRRRLGRGLAALLGDAAADAAPAERPRGQRKAPIEFLRPNPRNPRTSFREEDLAELTASIREKGVIQPIVVRVIAGVADAYEIIAGERRWRAAQMAGLSDVPVVIHEADDKEALELAIIENVQRADLNAIEEAKGYERLGAEFGYSHGEIAKIIGKSRSHIANTIRLLNLPEEAKKLVARRRDLGRPCARAARGRRSRLQWRGASSNRD